MSNLLLAYIGVTIVINAILMGLMSFNVQMLHKRVKAPRREGWKGAAMKLFAAVLILSATCWGQKLPGYDICKQEAGKETCTHYPDPAPLKCGKYQHVEQEHLVRDPSVHGYVEGIRIDNTPRCADDLHTVTEKEWQDLLKTVKDDTESIKMLHEMIRQSAGLPLKP